MKRTKDIFLEQREKEMNEGKYNYLINKLKQEQLYQQLKIKSNEKAHIQRLR
jgi:hypothetical protein